MDGVYSDLVTQCLDEAKLTILGMFEGEIGDYEIAKREWNIELKKIEEQKQKDHEEYKAWKNGWGKYNPNYKEEDEGRKVDQ